MINIQENLMWKRERTELFITTKSQIMLGYNDLHITLDLL
jgi:hypothetical protein